jgi:hypothetical protein
MDQSNSRWVAVFLLGNVLFNYPVLSLFNRSHLFLGIPWVYAYLFLVWALLIALAALTAETDPLSPS